MENEILKWIGTLFITISALQVSFNIKWSGTWWAYVGFCIGHIIWAIVSFEMVEWALFWLNFTFIFIDIYAIYIRINKPIGT